MATGDGRRLVFYDDGCGFCRRSAVFLARRDRRERLSFAPIGGTRFLNAIPAAKREGLPDSLVVPSTDGAVLVRSDAVLAALREVGGFWGGLALVVGWVPRFLRDAIYGGVARFRRLWPGGASCRTLPPDIRHRFAEDREGGAGSV